VDKSIFPDNVHGPPLVNFTLTGYICAGRRWCVGAGGSLNGGLCPP
jgi:hypothetical protein